MPPASNPVARSIARLVAPAVARRGGGITGLDLPDADRTRLTDRRRRATLLTCNHPTQHEPTILFMAAARSGLSPWFMAGRGMFDRLPPLVRWIVRGAGAFSVRRGSFDPDALRAARALLAAGRCLVVFPEGETYGMGSTTLPFQSGVGRLAHWGLEARRANDPEASLAVVPTVSFATFEGDPFAEIEEALAGLEGALGLARAASGYERLVACATEVAARVESDEGLEPAPDLDLNVRIDRVYASATSRLAERLGVDLPEGMPMAQRVRALMAAIPDEAADEETEAAAARFRTHAARLQAFVASRQGYVSEWPSAERILDQVGRLEREVFGLRSRAGEHAGGDLVRTHGPRLARVRVGEPIEVGERTAEWRADRGAEAAALTSLAEHATMASLRALERETTRPLEGFV